MLLQVLSYLRPTTTSEVGIGIVPNIQMEKQSHRGVGKCWDVNRGRVTSDRACALGLSSLLPLLCDISVGLVSDAISKIPSL